MINIIIVDAHTLFRIGIKSALQSECPEICVAGEAEDGISLLSLLETTQADMVLLDLLLPDMSGIAIAKRLRKQYPLLKILIISEENTTDAIIQLLNIGINGFISKQQATEKELAKAIYSIMDGIDHFGQDVASIIYSIYIAKKETTITTIEFTPREQEIIAMASNGLKSKEIARQLKISYRTVDTHKNNIFKKLGIKNTAELVQYAIRKNK